MEVTEAHMSPLDIHKAAVKWLSEHTKDGVTPEMVWVDIETTGLDFNKDLFLELGIVVTDAHGNVVPNGVFNSIIHAPEGVDWEHSVSPNVTEMHARSNLAQEVADITDSTYYGIKFVEADAIRFLTRIFGEDMFDLKLPMSGSSVSFDKNWIQARMPGLSKLFGYRIIDISTLRQVAALLEWKPAVEVEPWRGFTAHRVIPDIVDTINEYLLYTNQLR